jgi:hypothetical protein
MGNSFLEEQLRRMRQLTERMAQVHSRLTENCEAISRDRDAIHPGPLQGVRDYRIHETQNYADRADDQPAKRSRPRGRRR